MILGGLSNGARSVTSILILFFAMNLCYACVGTMLLGLRDPLHFGNFTASLLNLYKVTTLDWVDILMFNLHGCIDYDTGDYDLRKSNSSQYMWDSTVLNGPPNHIRPPVLDENGLQTYYRPSGNMAETDWEHDGSWVVAGCSEELGTGGKFAVLVYFFSFVILTVFVLFTMFMSAIAISVDQATRNLEKKANVHKVINESKYDVSPDVSESWVVRCLLLKGTVVDFDAASADTYSKKLQTITNSVGGQVYLSLLTSKHKDAMLKHAEISERLVWAFQYLVNDRSDASDVGHLDWVPAKDVEKPDADYLFWRRCTDLLLRGFARLSFWC
jgi:hypothetical protein